MKLLEDIKSVTKFERCLWLVSVSVIIITTLIFKSDNYLSIVSALLGVTSLIFVAKGLVLGQILIVAFSTLYGIISIMFSYYGEMITYLFMTTPMAVISMISWIRHPYKKTRQVEVSSIKKKQIPVMIILAAAVTFTFYFVLKFLGTANLIVSTISITTSFIAVYLSALRSPYYALGYIANDIVLIVLWTLAAIKDKSLVPTVACFVMFLANDAYGFYNWNRMKKKQNADA